MKTKITLLAVFLIVFFRCNAQLQVPNGGFENWTNAVTPNHWTSLESLLAIDTSILTFKDTIDFFQGSASIKLVTDSIPQEPAYGLVSAETSLGTLTLGSHHTQIYAGYPFTSRPDSFIFEYKYTSPGNDTGYAKIIMTLGGDTTILSAGISLTQASAWTSVSLPLDGYYNYIVNPDTLLIQFKSSHAAQPVKGSTLHIDAARFGYAPAVITSFQATIAPGGTTTICMGDSVTFQANLGFGETYQWNLNGLAIAGATSQSFVAKTSGSYTVEVDSSGVISTSMAATLVIDTPVASIIGLNDTVCRGSNAITLGGGSPPGGVYSGSGVTGSSFNPQSAGLGTDTVVYTVTDAYQCMAKASATITVVAGSNVVTLTGLDNTVCGNAATITLTGGSPAGGTYSGSGVTGSSFVPQLAAPGTDTIVYTYTNTNHCAGTASATITVDRPVVFLTGLNDSVCGSAGAVSLTGGTPGGGTYSGSGVTGSTFTPQLATPGTDTIVYTVTDLNHCTGSASATITVNQPVVSLTGLSDSVCSNAGAISLTGGSPAGGTYSGSGVTGSTFTPQSAALGTDTIVYTATDLNHCTGSASATITVNQASVSLTGLDDTICSNANAITLSGGSPAGGTYSGNGVSGSTFTPQLVSPGLDTIIYVATDANHCTGLAGATIYVEVCGGINSILGTDISIYPNPASDLLNINSSLNLAGLNAQMYDAFGRLVINQLLEESNNAINVSRLVEGIYIYRISDIGNAVIAQGKFNVVK